LDTLFFHPVFILASMYASLAGSSLFARTNSIDMWKSWSGSVGRVLMPISLAAVMSSLEGFAGGSDGFAMAAMGCCESCCLAMVGIADGLAMAEAQEDMLAGNHALKCVVFWLLA
jgi:hypothetical protein